jgi:hypothetical protein
MEPTIWGIIFVPLCTFLIFFKPTIVIGILILSLSLQLTTIVNFPASNYGFQLYKYLIILFSFYLLIKVIYKGWKLRIQNYCLKQIFFVLLAFLFYLLFISFAGPFIFSGIPVFPPLLGLDYSAVLGPSPLEFSSLDIVLPMYILFYSLTFFYIISYNIQEKDIKIILFFWKLSVFLTIFFLFLQFIFFFVINDDVLKYIVNSAPQGEYGFVKFEYLESIFPRLRGTFYEPSMISPFLIGIFIYKLSQLERKLKNILSLFIVLFLIFLTTSTTAYISLAIMISIYLVLNSPIRFKRNSFFLQKSKVKIIAGVLLLLLSIFIILGGVLEFDYFISFTISTFVLEKPETLSYYSRTMADIHSLQLFFDTYLMGVGMGSHRGSSLVANLLAITGILGTTLFLIFIYAFLKYSYKVLKGTSYFPYFYLLPSILIPMSISIPDLTLPTFWQFLYITTLSIKIVQYQRQKEEGIIK